MKSLLSILLLLLICSEIYGQPISTSFDSLASYPRLQIERQMVYTPAHSYMYSHHPYLTYFNGVYLAIWSNGMKDEDDPGQRIAISYSTDFFHWSEPVSLAEPDIDESGEPAILTAAGFYEHEGKLIAYYGSYSRNRTETKLFAKTTVNGYDWSDAIDVGLPVIPNHGPSRLRNGRLIICGNFSFPYSDNSDGLNGWQMTGFYPQEMGRVSDNPWSFWKISKGMGLPVSLCEGSYFQTGDGVIHMLLRSAGETFNGYLWLTESRDDGKSWSRPVATTFTDNDHKFHFGQWNGLYYYVGCPVSFPRGRRCPLVLSISADGSSFTDHYIIADQPYERRSEGRYKEGQYGYPSTFIRDGMMYIIVSRQKEGIEVIRFNMDQLK